MKLYYSDVLMPRKTCALARYLNAPVEDPTEIAA